MTVENIRVKMREIYDEYDMQSRNCTSVQMPSFAKKFGTQHGVTVNNGIITLTQPINLDEECTVQNVIESYEYVDKLFGGRKKVTCFTVYCTNNFSFSARLNSGADCLIKGQNIHISGNVSASIQNFGEYDGGIHIAIISKPFQIRFTPI